MYYYNSPFFTCKSTKNTFKSGKSAYEIAVENGFQGSVEEWLMSLKGVSPHIGENGNWFIGDIDTNVAACGDSGIVAKDAAERASQSAVVAGNYAAQAIQAQQAIENKIWYKECTVSMSHFTKNGTYHTYHLNHQGNQEEVRLQL